MDKPILYSFRRCPYAMRARMALCYSQQVCELREVVLKNKPAEMLAVSEKGTVPVLVLNDNAEHSKQVIDESLEVMYWALKQYDPDHWMRDLDNVASAASHPLIVRNDQIFTKDVTRYKYADRYLEASQAEHFEKCRDFLKLLEQSMVLSSDKAVDKTALYFINSESLSFLDVAIFPFVRQCLAVDVDVTQSLDLPKLLAWHRFLIGSELFKKTMVKYPMWTKEQTEVIEFASFN